MIIFKLIFTYLAVTACNYLEVSMLNGFIVGAITGHIFDVLAQNKLRQLKTEKFIKQQHQSYYNNTFLNTLFQLLGKLAAVDSVISKEELNYVEDLCKKVLKFKRAQKKEAIKIFHNAFRSSSSFQFDAAQFYEINRHQPQAFENMLVFLFELAKVDGPITPAEERLIDTAAQLFQIPIDKYLPLKMHFIPEFAKQAKEKMEQIKRKKENSADHFEQSKETVEPNIEEHYKILGCKKSDSIEVIKQKYRKLVSDYHPDKIIAKNLPEDFMRFANDKFKSIQEAYQAVKAERNIS